MKRKASTPIKRPPKKSNICKNDKNIEIPRTINELIICIESNLKNTNRYLYINKLKDCLPILKRINELIGLAKIKSTLTDIILHYIQGYNNDYLNMIIYGPPGCGKTTLAKLITQLFAKMRVVRQDKFTIANRKDFVADYKGQTTGKTLDFLNKAKGGVLFIDEAYSMAPNYKKNDDDSYEREAIDQLNLFLSENKSEIVCIMAGYEEDINNTIFKLNNGLERRFPWRLYIDKYNDDELLQIFELISTRQGYKIAENALSNKLFADNEELFEFSGGDVEVFFDRCKIAHSRNTFGKKPNYTLEESDILMAIEIHRENREKKKQDATKIPFGMYT